MWYIHSMEYCSALIKEGIPAICNNMDEPIGHYAKQNKSNTAWFHFMRYPKSKLIEAENMVVVIGGFGVGGWRVFIQCI